MDYQLVRELHWTWADLQAAPIEVRDYYWRCIQMEREVAAQRAQRPEDAAGQDPGVIRVAR